MISVGNAGTGKSQVWKTLFKTYQNLKKKPVYCDLNPKAVTNDELYGIINPATRSVSRRRLLYKKHDFDIKTAECRYLISRTNFIVGFYLYRIT